MPSIPGSRTIGAMASERTSGAGSPLAEALARVGDRWTLLIVQALLAAPRRFSDLLEEIDGLAPNILSQRLRQLEQHRLVVAETYSERPRRSLYVLTEEGRELGGALRHLSDWGARHSEEVERPRHAACGTALESAWYCPTCERPVADDDLDLHYL
jgi:DNA-binding HxlR family transcriptional regulator